MKKLIAFILTGVFSFLLATCEDISFRNDLLRLVANSVPTLSVVYNDSLPSDVTIANNIKAVFATNLASVSGVSGTMPSVTINLVGQSSVPTNYDSTYILAGVILVTPGCTVSQNVNQSQNLVSQGKGIFAMGSGGTRFLDTVSANWSAWGLSGQPPSNIGWLRSMVSSLSSVDVEGTVYPGPSTGAWSYPLSSTSIPSVDGNSVTLFSTSNGTVELEPGGTGYVIYGKDSSNSYLPVVRQDRFLQFGFSSVPDLPATGEVFFVNLVALMLKY